MFNSEREAASRQLARRSVSFKKTHCFICPDKLIDRHVLNLAGVKKYTGNGAWFGSFIDSKEFKRHFDTYTLTDWDDIAPEGTSAPSLLMERIWGAFSA
jgi:hypothetical protein